jgi:hypothetical protein
MLIDDQYRHLLAVKHAAETKMQAIGHLTLDTQRDVLLAIVEAGDVSLNPAVALECVRFCVELGTMGAVMDALKADMAEMKGGVIDGR